MTSTSIPLPPSLRTPAQQAASRLNGAQSHGPITPSGRRRSSRNATKHGLSGEGKSLPPDMEHELQSEITLFANQFHPTTDYEHTLIRRAALGSLRTRRISETLLAVADERSRLAIPVWDRARADQVAHLATLLHTNPALATRDLRQLTEGCDHLADSWESLAQTLQAHGFWTYAESLQALHHLGVSEPPQPSASSTPLALFWLCALSLLATHPDSRSSTPTPDLTPHILPADEALSTLLDLIQTEIEALESEASRLWETQDLPSRQSAPSRAAHDPTPDTARLERYLASADRMRRQALEELHRLRKNPTPEPSAPNEPTPTEPPLQDEPEPTTPEPLTASPSFPIPTPLPPSPAPSLLSPPEQTPPTTLTP